MIKHGFSQALAKLKGTFGLGRGGMIAALLFIAAVVLGCVYLSFHFTPPSMITMSSGPEGSTFARNAGKYREILERKGIKLRVLPSKGSLENLQRLNDPKFDVDIAFVQGGVAGDESYVNLMSLGSVRYEALRIFYRSATPVRYLSDFKGKKIVIGHEGSGTHDLALALLKLNGIEPGGETELLTLDADEGAKSLLSGEVDAIFMMGDSAASKTMRDLGRDPKVQLYSFVQANAYARRIRYLNKLVLPEGTSDFGKNIPAHDVYLMGPTVEIIARKGLHPAISDLLLEAAKEVHGRSGIFQQQGEFPSLVEHEFPISEDAIRYFKSGKSFLYRDLPFWLASFLSRVLLVVVPSLVVLIPSLKLIPTLYRWKVRLGIYRWYNDLFAIEGAYLKADPARREELLKRLGEIEESVNKYKVPASFADQLYGLRWHIMLVRQRLASH